LLSPQPTQRLKGVLVEAVQEAHFVVVRIVDATRQSRRFFLWI
jgi:hypothetical protein